MDEVKFGVVIKIDLGVAIEIKGGAVVGRSRQIETVLEGCEITEGVDTISVRVAEDVAETDYIFGSIVCDHMMLIEELFEAEGIPVVWEDETIEERKAR